MLNFVMYVAILGLIIMAFEKIFATTVGIVGFIALIGGIASLVFAIKKHRESISNDDDDDHELTLAERIPAIEKLKYPALYIVCGIIGVSTGVVKSNRQDEALAQKKAEFEAMAQSQIDAEIKENCKYVSSKANLAQLNSSYGELQSRALGENAMLHTSQGVYQRAGDLSEKAEKEYKAALVEESKCESDQRTKVYARLRKEQKN